MTRGFLVPPTEEETITLGDLAPWELQAVEAVGSAIEFWGFKRNQGRVWALLYLRGEPLTAADIQHALELSKGAVSMIIRELEHWGVVHRVREPHSSIWHFLAEKDLMSMIRHVIEERETGLILRVQTDLAEAEAGARAEEDTPPQVLERLARLRRFATLMRRAVQLFVRTAHLDVAAVLDVLKEGRATAPAEPPAEGV